MVWVEGDLRDHSVSIAYHLVLTLIQKIPFIIHVKTLLSLFCLGRTNMKMWEAGYNNSSYTFPQFLQGSICHDLVDCCQASSTQQAHKPNSPPQGHGAIITKEKSPLFPVSFTFLTVNARNVNTSSLVMARIPLKLPSVLNLYFIILKSIFKEISNCISPEGGLFM